LSDNVFFACGTTILAEPELLVTIAWLEACEAYFDRTTVTKPDFFNDGVWNAFVQVMVRNSRFRVQMLWGIRSLLKERAGVNPGDESGDSLDWAIPHWCAQHSLASNPRDYLYAVLGLTNLPIVPDYAKSVYEVFHEYITERLESTKCIDWFAFSGIGSFELDLSEQALPSWMPDYLRHALLESYPLKSIGSTDVSMLNEGESAFEIRGRALFVHSIIGPRTVKVQAQSFLENAEEFQFSGRLMDFVLDFMQRNAKYVTGIPPLKAIVDIIVASEVQTNLRYLKTALSYLYLLRETANSPV
jgi:hypothetical protein